MHEDIQRLIGRLEERADVQPGELAPLTDEARAVSDDVAAIRSDPRFTPIGREELVSARRAQAEAVAAQIEQASERLADELASVEAAALRPRVEITPEDRVLVGAWFTSLPKERQAVEYYAAITAGDAKTVVIVEGLPNSISPLTDEIRQKALSRKRERLAPEVRQKIAGLQARLAAREMAAGSFRRFLRDVR